MAEGLRERKKRQTRQYISDVATGLFLERGFDAVTIAEIAEAAEVSVNTVYNYFPAKEDLFFDREQDMVEGPSRCVLARRPGESAAHALLECLRRDIRDRSPYVGLDPGFPRFMRTVQESSTLVARLFRMQGRTVDRLAAVLRDETGAAPEDPAPDFVAHQLVGFQTAVFRTVARAMAEGENPDRVAEELLRKIDVMEGLLSEAVLNYAAKNTP
ncbi:TetR/AcrR family transcriptional regulator [Streptomyces sp. NPDC048636]|uniref:TetR/AcrR family transcriptional regulator n=1 Tax=Streptomyces sp. NPDC048636 TaxID=3155762 RepID=UPI00343437DF